MITFPPGLAFGPVTPGRGRSIIATQTFAPGATIALFSGTDPNNPTISVPDNEHLTQTCHFCLSVAGPPMNYYTRVPVGNIGMVLNGEILNGEIPAALRIITMRACSGCMTAYYCSRACQKADWGLAHGKGECKIFRRVRDLFASKTPPANWGIRVLPSGIRALVQVLLRPEMAAAVADMEAHVDKNRTVASGGTRADIEFQARASLHYMGREATPQSITEAADIMCKIQVNSFSRSAGDNGQNGFYSNAALAMLNHSCIPNAFVHFSGRDATLHAYREIKEGEEIEISYIDNDMTRPQRQKALKTRYYFACVCPRCRDDLDVYQICQSYPHLELNSFSLVPDLNKLRHPPIKEFLSSNKPLQQNVEEIYSTCMASLLDLNPAEKHRQLCQRWKMCAQLRKAELYAVEPLGFVLGEANPYLHDQGKQTYVLAIACFLALNVHPYRGPSPFYELRVKNILVIAKLLGCTISTIRPASGTSLTARISQALGKMDRETMCQVLLTMGIHDWQVAHSKEWPVYLQAKDFLNDIESIPGRGTKKALVDAFTRNPNGSEERRFFETAVLEPIRVLAGFALEIMDTEFDT
ncbi:SET domain-containing protein [Hypoxylon sp. FL0890]|nr:SET domain-containing protein [Hypoxylon sp. FL0890]